ncbi:hypothetical protein RM549_04065 [Salegentibacter sp. F188]|uniref:Glycoside hydrolase family 65 n=1 Tax=Autumnicola patrickiae TaxID=3075591 RepID=A0ABU3DZ40_9FLAO|nr:hypothetical protein [Salegentibacter sp. F188]MDT0688945.1 hypothetical protein [Salegentibacter sp. F188]
MNILGKFYLVIFLFCNLLSFGQNKIDRKAVVSRHNVKVNAIDTLASLSVGNGSFAFTVDATGLQTFPDYYQNGVPLGTQSDWGWDSFPNTENYTFEETLEEYDQNGRKVTYGVQPKTPERAKEAAEYFRANPHRLHLGSLGFELYKKDGEQVQPEDITDIDQTLNLWTGGIISHFKVEGVPVSVQTFVHQEEDVIGIKIESDLIKQKQLKIRIRIPYPTGEWMDTGTKWEGNQDYDSSLSQKNNDEAVIFHKMDSINYNISLAWKGKARIAKKETHYFLLQPLEGNSFSFSCKFSNKRIAENPSFSSVKSSSKKGWEKFWESGGAVDFSECKDSRAMELERRVVLSQYLTKLQCTGEIPPQENGLTYNSWYGKPHLEMHWWHGVHFPLWGRSELLEKSLPWYDKTFNKARKIAERQGFDGVRWQKMTDPYGDEGPSSVGAFLIWQQPHFITFSELMYRANPNKETLEKYSERVFATADFMASFAQFNPQKKRYELGPPVIPAQERFKKTETYNPTYELAYWKWGLNTALKWKNRLNQDKNPRWADVAEKISDLPVQNNVYLATENAVDSYTNTEYKTDHPSVLGAFGMLPATEFLDQETMNSTFNKVWKEWSWEETWGWDFPMTAMTAARLGQPNKAIDALFMDVQTNTYLKNGHNYQDKRLRLYLPGNGGLLTAVAMMCAGWDGSTERNPGFPDDGNWEVKWEGLMKMP